MSVPTLMTERLILRNFQENDLEAIFKIFSDEKINTFLPWFPLKTLQEAKEFYEKNYMNSKGYKYAICLKEENVPIGYIHVSQEESHDFGYGLLEEYWRKGIVSEASRAILEQLKKDGIPFITATHDMNNPHSGYVMKAIGMKYQYTYQELWQPKNKLVYFRMYQLSFVENQNVYKKYWDMYSTHFIEENI